jgi:DNA-binding CsgD family transcriptional regulator
VRSSPRVELTDVQRKQLKRWAMGRSTPYRLVVRAHIVLLAADGHSDRKIARSLRVNPLTVARWRSRFILLGADGLSNDAPRLGPKSGLPPGVVETVLERTLSAPPTGGRWSTRSMARAVGVSHSSVRRIWAAHGIRPNESRLARLARSRPESVRPIDVVGVYVSPPRKAIAISLGEREAAHRAPPRVDSSEPTALAPPDRRPYRSRLEDLYTSLTLLDRGVTRASPKRLNEQEFFAFLRSVVDRRSKDEQVQLLTGTSLPTVPSSLGRWLRCHPQFSVRSGASDASLRRLVSEWVLEVSPTRPPDPSLSSAQGLRSAVDQWVRTGEGERRPFAWMREG